MTKYFSNKHNCWMNAHATNEVSPTSSSSRQQRFRVSFQLAVAALKTQYGHGEYSYAEGMTRKACRRIARRRARVKKQKA